MLSNHVLSHIIDSYNLSDDLDYELCYVDPIELVNKDRLDIIAKLIYLENKNNDYIFAKECYNEYIRAMTKDSFIEAGSDKIGLQAFLNEFEKIFKSISEIGYKNECKPIPVDTDMRIIDGAHRVSALLYENRPVPIIKLPVKISTKYNYTFFNKRGIAQYYLDTVIMKYLEMKNNIYIANVWPAASGKQSEIETIINSHANIVYYKEVYLSENGAFNYIYQIYPDELWVGSIDDGYAGVYRKQAPCFTNNDNLRIYIIEAEDQLTVKKIKDEIRALFGIGNHSIHITDNMKEAISMANLLLNKNTIEFLNNGYPLKYKKSHKMFQEFVDKNINRTVFITGSIVLALYGIREAEDVDYLCEEVDKHSHNNLINKYPANMIAMTNNPRYWFFYKGVKCISLETLKKFKHNRGETKDIDDIKLIDNTFKMWSEGKNIVQVFLNSLLIFKRKTLAKIQGLIIKVAHKTGTYTFLRNFYRKVK